MAVRTTSDALTALEKIYGPPSDAAFGSAVFFHPEATDLEEAALDAYRQFLGARRTGDGSPWTSVWGCCHERSREGPADIVAELQSLTAVNDRSSADMLLGLEGGPAALRGAFDDPAATGLAVYRVGDGEALSGLVVAGARPEGVTSLVFLMD